ncbi:MAG: phosphatidylserine/phosphatidylglycerophosphate/cardiolipin synthase family protein [Chloroflexi bacterium]|nr:phosphatidylserine/phosphatidylglycerophosphate/cardiolipin synthase family protein [Chloroflexota bacterium]
MNIPGTGLQHRRILTLGRHAKPSWGRLALRLLGVVAGMQAATIAALQVLSYARTSNRPKPGFPHPDLAPVRLGDMSLQIHPYGRDLFDSMIEAIDGARETIYFETYIWKGDGEGKRFRDHLIRKAAEGIEVYVIYDDFGNLVVPHSFKKSITKPMHVLSYRGLERPWQAADPRHYALEHRKVLAVDGRTAFIGGYNIGDLYAEHWRDTHLRLEGPDAADFADEFIAFWNKHGPSDDRISRRYRRRFNPCIQLEANDAMKLTFPVRDMYIKAIDNAEERIRVTNAYFVPDSSLLEALLRAADRGVDVQVLVPWVSNHVLTDYLARGYFTRLLKAGVRVFGYRSMLHAKTCTIDGQWTTIGTANLDRLSSVGNFELNVEVYNPDLATQMEDVFACDVTHARELRWEDWQRRPWYEHWAEGILEPLRAFL